jgi:hypothetical protein
MNRAAMAAVVLAAFAGPAHSDGLTIGAHLVTHHMLVPEGAKLTDSNPGLYVRMPSGLTLGAYRNSYGLGSAYAGNTWQTASGTWALTAGLVTGYPNRPVAPLLVPSVRLPLPGLDGYAFRLALLPKPRPNGAAGLHLCFEAAL